MDDRLSLLPDPILCHILSFLPTKQSVATSVLSKRLMPLWRSVPTLDLEYSNYTGSKEEYARFVHSVYAFIVSRDMHHPIQKFRLNCSSHYYDPTNVSVWVNVVVQCKVQHLELSLRAPNPLQPPPNLSSIFTCKTLVVLKLRECNLEPISSVDLPFLKVMHLELLWFSKRGCLAQLLSGCPLLEDFKASYLYFHEDVTDREFKTLPNLLRAKLSARTDVFLLGVVSNVKFLHIDEIDGSLGEGTKPYNFPMFHNLTHLELVYICYKNDWSEVFEFLKCCPKLQVLIINQPSLRFSVSQLLEVPENWQYPPSVPKCILLHLKTCCLNNYRGTKGDFQLAKYIMRNGRFLKRLTISSSLGIKKRGKLELLKKLSSCKRRSATCKLSFN